ncbi:unnamed protein product [Mycena citricolor]|uniref:DUF6535 domain-containing protein n=1 Tax=Mycena citricolor TaxID=2018698 RepID=A0AAD2GU95_9AGAR|nr:unnamed protein product [Mycena citricolor]
MSQAEKEQADKRKAEEESIERERASGNKLWSAYISEAQNYDQGLLEGWRSEMDGMLIFAGLFSGVITTFIIDSYKTLNPDSGSQTVVLLSQTVALLGQISLQLANMSNGTAIADALPPAAVFSPPISSLVCNVLWFTSLALSLSSALVATLVKQWAQEYQHRTSMFSSPSVRAPLLLFFAGLVAFLVPINIIIMGISSALLILFISVYATFTAHPLFYLDSPFQTPLTRILWSLNQSLGHTLRVYIWRAMASCKVFIRTKVAVPDAEKATESAVTSPGVSGEAEDTHPQSQSMIVAVKSAALHPAVETEIRALAWTVRSLSDDDDLERLVEGLPVLWDFDQNKPRSVYREHFHNLLRHPEIHLCQRLADFMDGSKSNLLEDKVRLRRQLSVLRAIWAICAFSLHTGLPLQSAISEADAGNTLLGSRFHTSPDVQSMLPDVTALIRLNKIESRSREQASTQPSNSDSHLRANVEEQRQRDMHRTYLDYLLAHSKCAASFQRDATISLFDRSQMRFTEVDGYNILQIALRQLIRSALENGTDETTADNVVFAARQMISQFAHISVYPYRSAWGHMSSPFAQSSEYPGEYLPGLETFLVRHPSLAASDQKFDAQHHYTRFLCHMLCGNFAYAQKSFDALQLIYRKLLKSDVPLKDLGTHLLVLRTLRKQAATICTHRLAAIVQSVALKSPKDDLLEWERLPNILNDEGWFRAVLGLGSDKRTERASAQEIYHCACVGVWTTFFEQYADTELERRFAAAAAAFIRKYPQNCLADGNGLDWVLGRAADAYNGWMTDVDALRVLDVAVSEVQTADQQESHRDHAQEIREHIQNRLHPKNSLTPFVLFGGGRV